MKNRVCYFSNDTISFNPRHVHISPLLRCLVSTPYSWSTPLHRCLALVFIGYSETLLCPQPSLVGWEELETSLHIIKHSVLSCINVATHVIDVKL